MPKILDSEQSVLTEDSDLCANVRGARKIPTHPHCGVNEGAAGGF